LTGVLLLLLVTVTACAALAVPDACVAKVSDVVETVNDGTLPPVPASATDCVAGLALPVNTSVADRLPKAVGANLVSTVQLAEAAREPGQLFICVNEVGFVPPKVMELRASAPLPEFVSVMAWAGL
jgi:hypothetical protein